ncbi:MAG: M23 family metallopeptidase [Oscillatoria sp. SIO1A7]|nr:M23 family metallopeptidase [Oscillatoria sp. SIO1A7]
MQDVAKNSLSEFYPKLFFLAVILCLGLGVATPNARAAEDRDSSLSPGESGCPLPALERLKLHRVASGETLASIAQQYELLPATLLGMNPVLRRGEPPVGTEILIPPYNGIRLRLQPGETFEEIARKYNLRHDLLFEVNGCQLVGDEIFVPGVNWSPLNPTNAAPPRPPLWVIPGYPLASKGGIILAYGQQLRPGQNKVAFHSGIDIYAQEGDPVLAAGDGVVVFAGYRGAYGNLVVINHAENKQTRYAHLQGFSVQSGQQVRRGDRIGTVGSTGRPDISEFHLHFEVRSASELGWVAENPEVYLR